MPLFAPSSSAKSLARTTAICKPYSASLYLGDGGYPAYTATPVTYYGKIKCAGVPKRVRVGVINQTYQISKAYTQTANLLTVASTATTVKGLVAGDMLYVSIESGNAKTGWYPVSSISGTSIIVTMEDSQTTSGNASYSLITKGYKISVALTERPDYTTARDLYVPVVGDVDYPITSTTSGFGLRTLKFGADLFVNGAASGVAPAGHYVAAFTVAPVFGMSDWIDLPSVPSLDGQGGNFLFRFTHDCQTFGLRSEIDALYLTHMNNQAFIDALGLTADKQFRRHFQTVTLSVDGVTSPEVYPSTTAPLSGAPLFFEFDYGVAVQTVAVFGDSTTASSTYSRRILASGTFTANIAADTMTLTSAVNSDANPVPIFPGQLVTFTGQVNLADGTPLFVTSLISGTPGAIGAVYRLPIAQTTATRTVTLGTCRAQSWESWASRAVYSKSSPTTPVELFNGGWSGRTTRFYLREARNMLARKVIPAVVFLQGYSYNNSPTPTQDDLARVQADLLDTIGACKAAGVGTILVGTWPITPVAQASSSYPWLLAHNDWIRGLGAAGVVSGVPDFDKIRQDLGSTVFFSPDGSIGFAALGDQIHQGKVAEAPMEAEFLRFL